MQHNMNCIVFSRVITNENKTGATEYSAQLIEFVSSIFSSIKVVISANHSNFEGFKLSEFKDNVDFYTYERKKYSRIKWALSEYPSSTERMIPRQEQESIENLIKTNTDSVYIIDNIGSGWVLK